MPTPATTAISTELRKDKSLVGSFTARRSDHEMKLAVEASHLEAIADSSPKVMEAWRDDPASFRSVLLDTATLGLTLSPTAGLAYAIPYGKKVGGRWIQSLSLVPSYKGFRHQVLCSGAVTSIDNNVVRENDVFDYWWDDQGPHYKFVPARKNRGALEQVYSYARFPDGTAHLEVMDADDIKHCIDAAVKSRNFNKLPDDPAEYEKLVPSTWKVWTAEMWRKSCDRRARKRWPATKGPGAERLNQIFSIMDKNEGYSSSYEDEDDVENSVPGESVELIRGTDIEGLHEFMADSDIPESNHQFWLQQIAKAMGFPNGISSVPRNQIDDVKARITKRVELIKAKTEGVDSDDQE